MNKIPQQKMPLSKDEFEALCKESHVTVVSDTFASHEAFAPDLLLRQVKLTFRSESAWGFMRAISHLFVFCPDGIVRNSLEIEKPSKK